MLRFCGEKQTESDSLEIVILEEKVLINDNLWQNGKVYFRRAKRKEHYLVAPSYRRRRREYRMLWLAG